MKKLLLFVGALLVIVSAWFLAYEYAGDDESPKEDALNQDTDRSLYESDWVWEYTELPNQERFEAPPGERFVLSFDEKESRLGSTTDCNSLGGDYLQEGNVLTIGPLVSTLMYCDGSVEGVYASELTMVTSFEIVEERLVLTLSHDQGKMFFKKKLKT